MQRIRVVGFIQLSVIYLSYGDIDSEHDASLQKQGIKCGIIGKSTLRNKGAGSRIINGEPTNVEKYPWLATIILNIFDPKILPYGRDVSESGGTIISQRSILTCMHCVCNRISRETQSGKERETCLPQKPCKNPKSQTCLPVNQNRENDNEVTFVIGNPAPAQTIDLRYNDHVKVYL